MGLDVKSVLVDPFDRYWRHTLRPGLAAVTEPEYLWEPFPNCLSVRKQGDLSWRLDPAPLAPAGFEALATIGWRMEHIAQLLVQTAANAPAPEVKGTAADALGRIDEAYVDWQSRVADGDETQPAQILQLTYELIREGGQVSLMRDLYRAKHLDRLRTRRPSDSRRRH